ncbi:MAG TPA: hypothetical protein VGN41_14050 [Streptosporangiaceae bacterium]
MGWGDLVQQAVTDASGDMAKVQNAADAISAAIKKAQPWLTPDTWQGSEATAWMGEWETFYARVMSCLNELPAAEASVVSQTRTQMEKLARQHAGQPAPS